MHAAWVMKALTAGKHVLCEKPLTMSAADSVALYETARGVGRHLSEAFMWPHHPRAQRLHDLVADGQLGPLVAHQGTVHVPARPRRTTIASTRVAAAPCSTVASTASGRRCA